MYVSFTEDEFINNKKEGEARWYVTLNDGTTVYQDDDRPNVEPHSAWLRLKSYCEENNLHILNMHLQFRSHHEAIEPNADGYFFRKMALAGWGTPTIHYFVVGILKGSQVYCKKWRLPELIVEGEDERDFSDCVDSLISKRLFSYTFPVDTPLMEEVEYKGSPSVWRK